TGPVGRGEPHTPRRPRRRGAYAAAVFRAGPPALDLPADQDLRRHGGRLLAAQRGRRHDVIRAIFPASFDPITNGHLDVATRASRLFDDLVIAVYDTPAKALLFSLEERVALARASTAHLPNVRVEEYSGLTV